MKNILNSIPFALLIFSQCVFAQSFSTLSGSVKDQNGEPIIGANIVIKESNQFAQADSKGHYSIDKVKQVQDYTLIVDYIGYAHFQKKINLSKSLENISIELIPNNVALSEISIVAKSKVQQVKEKAFNVAVIDAVKLHSRAMDISHALDKTSGMRVREDGGVGSNMNVSLNGYSGNQIKFFVDGIPMDNFGSAFQLNNIPINLANRIEIYKGVVPVGLGSDALGGAINIITNTYDNTSLDMSYSYGSFNTHRTNINFVYVDKKSGFYAQMNAYQNYSDNDYKVQVNVNDIATGEILGRNVKVKRFHDKFHNENFVGQIGVVKKSFADRIALGITLGQSYKEVQTGARMESVFGKIHQKGDIIMPTFVYQKNNLFTEGLDVKLNANYNLGSEQVIDTVYRRYNWLGDYVDYEKKYGVKGGERNRSMYKFKNNNGMVATIVNYKLGSYHNFSLSNTINFFKRKGNDALFPNDVVANTPATTTKNISGLSYQYTPNTSWSATVFGKYYNQKIDYTESYNPSGKWGDYAYRNYTSTQNNFGFGLTGSVFVADNFQIKSSFEKSIRLPTATELFGDKVNIDGNNKLKPELSYNYNLGFAYHPKISKNSLLNLDMNVFYRDSKDFIRQKLDGKMNFQTYDNIASITNTGIEGELRYYFKNSFNIGINGTYQDLRNTNKYIAGVKSDLYKDRLPNIPYLFGNADVNYTFRNIGKEASLTMGYSVTYIKEFYLFWPSMGSKEDGKFTIPDQVAHDFFATYTFGNQEKFQVTAECKNIFDKMIYDNFSLQKPGRSFVAKFRYFF